MEKSYLQDYVARLKRTFLLEAVMIREIHDYDLQRLRKNYVSHDGYEIHEIHEIHLKKPGLTKYFLKNRHTCVDVLYCTYRTKC